MDYGRTQIPMKRIWACWHSDTNLEVILGWMPWDTYVPCSDIMKMYFRLGHSHDVNILSQGDGALKTNENAHVIAYLQASGILLH